MADEPISTTVPETTTVETGADPETLGSLTDAFEDFWKEQDDGGSTEAPAAPGATGAAQETKDSKPKPEPKTERPESAETIASRSTEGKEKEVSDEDIEKMALRNPQARPEDLADFKQIRELLKGERARFKAAEAKRAEFEQQLAEARQQAMTPEIRADYEHAAQIRRRFDFASDPEFVQKYQLPIRNRYETILDEIAEVLPDRDNAYRWVAHMKANYSPEQLSKQWWQDKVFSAIPGDLDRDEVRTSVAEINRLMKERDTELQQRTSNEGNFQQWINEKAQFTNQRVTEEIMAEISEREKVIQDYLPRDEESAKTNEERAAIKEHNTRFTKLNDYFKGVLQDIGKNGPRAWVRASIEATRAQILEENFKNLEKEHQAVVKERDRYKSELDKITGVRRKLSQTSGTAPASSKKDGAPTSIKDLDIRKAFDAYDWNSSDNR